MVQGFRVELFAKTGAEVLQQKDLLRHISCIPHFEGFNLPNKSADDPMQDMTSTLSRIVPGAPVCVHYSCAYRAETLSSALKKHQAAESILVVSGTKPRKGKDAIAALADIGSHDCRLGVAFNPFKNVSDELARLRLKAKCPLVRDVWLQIGTDRQKLEAALRALRTEFPRLRVYGSVLLPTPQQLQQWRFRPWSGTAVEARALTSLAEFGKSMRQCVEVLWSHGATPLIETRVASKNLDVLRDFLMPAGALASARWMYSNAEVCVNSAASGKRVRQKPGANPKVTKAISKKPSA